MSKSSVNTEALSTARYLDRVHDLLSNSVHRLSSGNKFVKASDDPQGIGLAQKITAQNRRIQAASVNVQNAMSYLQTADGAIGSMSRMVTRMSELSILARDPMKNSADIALYQTEFRQIQEQLRTTIGGTVAEIGGTAGIDKPLGSFNGISMFGPNPAGQTIATGDTKDDSIRIPESNLRVGSMLQLISQDAAGTFVASVTDASAAVTIEGALQQLADERGSIGAVDRRFTLAAETLRRRNETMISTLSGIQDVDVARESTRVARFQMLSESATTILAQANQSPKAVLQFLREAV